MFPKGAGPMCQTNNHITIIIDMVMNNGSYWDIHIAMVPPLLLAILSLIMHNFYAYLYMPLKLTCLLEALMECLMECLMEAPYECKCFCKIPI